MNIDWNEVLEHLKTEVITVKFIKADGSTRVMNCTLVEDLLPPVTTERKPNPEVVVVLDVDKGAWRSFRKERVLEVSYNG